MPAHSRSKNGVASLAYVAASTSLVLRIKGVDGRDKPGHDELKAATSTHLSF
jgi:hypothetical protein